MSDSENPEQYECDRCGAEVTETDTACPRCGSDVSNVAEEGFGSLTEGLGVKSAYKPKSRYPALITISTLYRILAWLSLIGSIVAGIIWDGDKSDFSFPLLIEFIIVGVIGCITFLAIAEGIMVFIDIEYNTRKTAELLSRKD
jgi:hypothetical protein